MAFRWKTAIKLVYIGFSRQNKTDGSPVQYEQDSLSMDGFPAALYRLNTNMNRGKVISISIGLVHSVTILMQLADGKAVNEVVTTDLA